MMKRLLSLLLMLGVLLCAAVSLGEEAPSLSAERISALQRLAGEDGAIWQEGTQPSADMNAFQMWQWTDWFLSNRVRSLLGAIQDYQRMESGALLNTQIEKDQWQLRGMESILSRFEAQLEEDRLAILNGISLYQSSETDEADRLAAYHRILEAEAEIRQIITSICRDYKTYLTAVNDCSGRLQASYSGYTTDVQTRNHDSLEAEAGALEASEKAAGAGFSVSVVSTYQICIRVCDPDGNPVKGASVTVTNQLNNDQKQADTDANGDAVFWVSDLGADEANELRLSLRVGATGYRTRETQTVRLRGGETRTVELQKDNGEPYLVMGCFDGRDILAETNTYYSSADNTVKHAFTVKLHCGSDGELELRYSADAKAEEYRSVVKPFSASDSDHTVLVFEDQWLSKLIPGARVSLTIKTGGMEYTTDTLLVIQKPMVEKPILSGSKLFSILNGSDSMNISIPDGIPFIGGSTLSIDIPDVLPQAVYLPSYRALYALGYDFKPEQATWQTRDAEDEARAVKEFEVKGKADEALASAGAYRDINTTVQSRLLGEQSAYVTPFAALQGQYDTRDRTLELSGTAGAAMAFHTDLSQTFSIGLAPFYAGMTVDMGTGFGMDVTLDVQLDMTGSLPEVVGAPKTGYESGSSVSFRMDMRATSGMGVRDDVTVDVSGYGSLTPTADFARGNMTATLDMGVYATMRKLFTKWKSAAWEGRLSLGENAAAPTPDTLICSMPVNERVEPQSESKYNVLINTLDIAADEAQFATIGTDTYMFWILPGMGGQLPRLKWFNLSELNKYIGGEIKLGQVDYGDVSYLHGIESNPQRQNQIMTSDYAFALDVREDYCALTILNGVFPSAGSGEDPAPPSRACVATVLMRRNDGTDDPTKEGGLEMKGYQEWSTFNQGVDYPIMPEVHLLENNGILSAYVTAGSPEKISSQLYAYDSTYRDWTGAFLQNTQSLTCADAAEITRYRIADVSAAGSQQFYSLSRTSMTEDAQGALSRLTVSGNACTREVLAEGNIINFRVYEQTNTGSAKDRLFYLERVELEEGKYTQRLKSWTNTAAGPVITDYDVELVADSFDIVQFGSGVYLYWTESSAPTGSAGQGIQAKYLVRCVRYDPGTDTVSGPFSLVKLSERPSSIRLLDDGTGYYTVDLESSHGSYVRQSLSTFTYTLVSAAELTAAAPTNPSVRAGDYAEIVFSVRNTGNVPLSAFDVKLCNGSQELQTLHIDCINPENNSSTMGTRTISGAQSVSRISSIYDPLNHDSWNIVQTQAGRSAAARKVQTDMLMPGDTHSYTARLLVPADWAGGKSLTAAIDSVEGKPALNGVTENGILTLTGASDASIPMRTLPDTGVQTLNTDVHDLSLSAQLVNRGGVNYVHVSIRNLSGNTESAVTPVLTATYRGESLFSHAFRNPMGDDFGYSMDIPLTTLTKGRNLPELELHVSGLNGAQYEEFADSDNHVRLMLSIVLFIAEQPEDVYTTEGQDAAFSVTAGGGVKPYIYQWQRMTGANQWTDIPGANQDVYRIESVTNEQNGLTVRCVVTDQFGDSVISDPAMLTEQLIIVRQPESISLQKGQDAAFSVAVSGGVKPYRYQWQRMIGENQWMDIPGAAQDTYRIPSVSGEQNGLTVRCVISDQQGDSVTSDAATLTVLLHITRQPESISVPMGQDAAFSVAVSGGEQPYRYQWQRMIGENQWMDIPGAVQDTYRIPSATREQNGLTVRCVVADQLGDSVTSDAATLTILPPTVRLFIAGQPESISVSEGMGAAFSVTAGGGEAPYRYQWQRMTRTDQWTDIPGADQDTYRVESVTSEQNGLTVRCVVTDQYGDSVASDSAELIVLPQTGDRSQLTMWLLLALSSMGVLVIAYRRRSSR